MESRADADGPCRAADARCAGHRACRDRPARGRRADDRIGRATRVRDAASRRVPALATPHRARRRGMNRLDATRQLVAALGSEPIVASLGHPTYDLFAAGDRAANFYTWGSMGMASSIGLGLALARPDLRVFVVDGDGSLLMNLGSLATIGWTAPENLVLIVWDNEEYGTTGGQRSATAHGADLAAAARALGIRSAMTVRNERELRSTIADVRRDAGPHVIVAKVDE